MSIIGITIHIALLVLKVAPNTILIKQIKAYKTEPGFTKDIKKETYKF